MAYFNNAHYQALVEKFLESADYEFECSEIAGRQFESLEDHAAYLREGGCQQIIDDLVNSGS